MVIEIMVRLTDLTALGFVSIEFIDYICGDVVERVE